MYKLQKTLVYFLILTIVGAGLAYYLVVKAYSVTYTDTSLVSAEIE